jgi:hypothetical protein
MRARVEDCLVLAGNQHELELVLPTWIRMPAYLRLTMQMKLIPISKISQMITLRRTTNQQKMLQMLRTILMKSLFIMVMMNTLTSLSLRLRLPLWIMSLIFSRASVYTDESVHITRTVICVRCFRK